MADDGDIYGRIMDYANGPSSSNMFRGGGYGGGQSSINANPAKAIDPGIWARLMGYATNLSPISSAHAGGVPAPDSPAARQAAIAAAAAQINNGGPGAQPPGPQGPPIGPTTLNPHILPGPQTGPAGPIRAGGGSSGGAGASATIPSGDPRPYDSMINRMMPNSPPMGPPPPPTAPPQASAPMPPVRPASLGGGAPAAAAIDPRMRGEVPPAVQPGWGMIDRPNANPGIGGGMLGPSGPLAANQGPRGNGGAPQMGAFDFSNLFGGGQPAQPKARIDVGKIPADMRAEVPPQSPGPMDASIAARQKIARRARNPYAPGGSYNP